MKFLRFSIASLVGTVATCAIGLSCLMFASTPWAGVVLSVALGALTLALLGVFYRRGERRAFWAGFALCGWTYMTLSSGPWFTDHVRPRLVTTNLLGWAYPRLIPADRQLNLRNAKRAFTVSPVVLVGGLTSEELSSSLVDVWVKGEGEESPSLLMEGVEIVGVSGSTINGVDIRADADQSAKLARAQAKADSRPFILRPHSPGLFAPLWSSPPVEPWQFERVGHPLFGLLCAWIGSVVARYFFATREHAAAAATGGR